MSYSFRAACALVVSSGALLAACSDSSTAPAASIPVVAAAPPTGCSLVQTLTAGQVVTGLSGSSLCIGGVSSAAEYALVPFNSDTSVTASFSVAATGVLAPSASSDLISSAGLSATLSSLSPGMITYRASRGFELGLRRLERASLPALMPGARRWAQSRSGSHAAFDVIPGSVSVGQILSLNANTKQACSSPAYRGGRVVAITNRAIVVADTGNPSGGFTDAEYAALGTTFDTLVDPLDRSAFGDPSDIDGNGHVVIFFTKTVNDLTPLKSTSYVGGFFFARDLFPLQASANAEACAGSNMGEMFYVMVPDPTRAGPFTKASVSTEVTGTLAHEYQHLINASRRLYVNNANNFEETWLDEGLAHVAEELLFYKASGLSPRQNIDVSTVRSSAAAVSAFNSYASSNFGRYEEYLGSPSKYSPIASNDSLATRGASWSFLRYAADHQGSTDGTTFYRLVNSQTTGIANLRNVFGANVLGQLRDWGTSVLTDDVNGVSGPYQQPSWNFRSIYATLNNASLFPIATSSLASSAQPVTLVRGANAYLRFAVAAGGSATVQWPTAPGAVQFSLVRLQ